MVNGEVGATLYGRNVRVPVWSEAWEIDWCQPDAEVGKSWSVPLSFVPGVEPRWVTEFAASVPKAQRDLGVVSLDLHGERAGERPLYHAGALVFGCSDPLSDGSYTGRLWVDAHSSAADARTLTGTVSDVQLVPIRSERLGARLFVPVAQLDPIRVSSTRERDRYEQRSDHQEISPLLLVTVSV